LPTLSSIGLRAHTLCAGKGHRENAVLAGVAFSETVERAALSTVPVIVARRRRCPLQKRSHFPWPLLAVAFAAACSRTGLEFDDPA